MPLHWIEIVHASNFALSCFLFQTLIASLLLVAIQEIPVNVKTLVGRTIIMPLEYRSVGVALLWVQISRLPKWKLIFFIPNTNT